MALKIAAWVLIAGLCVSTVPAALSAPSLRDYGALPTIEKASLSPDGKLIAFQKNSEEGEIVAVVSIEDGKFLRGLDVSDIKLRDLYFFNESKVVSVTSEHRRVSGFRGSFDVSTAFLLDLTSGKIDQLLTPGDVIYTGQSGLGRIVGASPDGRYVFMPAYVPKSSTDQSPDYSLVKVDLQSPRRPSVVERGKGYTQDYFLDSKGNLLAEERFESRTNSHTIIAYHNDQEKIVFSQQVSIPDVSVVGVTPDGLALLVNDQHNEFRNGALRAMNLADGKFSEPLFARKGADVEHAITDINRTVFGVMYSGLRPSYEFFNKGVERRVQAIVDAYPKHSVWLVDWSDDWQHLLVLIEGQTTSGQYMLYSEGKEPRFLANSRPNIQPQDVNPVVEFSYKARDGLVIPALVTVPASRMDTLQNLPAIMLPHGGPAAHDWLGFDWLAQALAAQGYLVVQPQFRGSSGFGLDHWLAGHGEWGKKMQDDLTDAINALAAQKLVDPSRICIVGASYGGYAALAGGALTPDLYKCVVSINGVSDLNRMLVDERSDHGRDHYVVRYWKMLIAKGEDDKKALNEISPSHLAGYFKAPVLLLHGKQDEVVDFEQSRVMEKALKKAGKSVKLIKLDKEDHFLSQSSTRLKTLDELLKFVNQHLKQKQ